MKYQNEKLPDGLMKVGNTDSMTETTVLKGILQKHRTSKGKYALVVVEEGALQFVYEDEENNIFDADTSHHIVITLERFHHVILTGSVLFRVEFYEASSMLKI